MRCPVSDRDRRSGHSLHTRPLSSSERPALIITHGWPGPILELVNVIGPLTDPIFLRRCEQRSALCAKGRERAAEAAFGALEAEDRHGVPHMLSPDPNTEAWASQGSGDQHLAAFVIGNRALSDMSRRDGRSSGIVRQRWRIRSERQPPARLRLCAPAIRRLRLRW
jgi:hypothetical protein